MRRATVALSFGVALIAGCGGSGHQTTAGLRIYDPTGHVADEVVAADIVASSVRSGPDGGAKTDFIAFELTSRGRQHFHALTAGLAHRGARRHRVQHFAFAVDGHVYARPYIDYRMNPDGVDASTGIEIPRVAPKTAKRIAAALRRNAP